MTSEAQKVSTKKRLGSYCVAINCHNARKNCNLSMFPFPGMRKGVENGFKTPDVKTLGVLQPRNYTTLNYARNTLKSLNL